MLGYPIRTSSDPRSVDNSPRHIAASHVLHRLPMPRHPPCALTHLHNTKQLPKAKLTIAQDMLKTCSNNCLDARNHYPQIKHHTPPPRRGDNTTHRRAQRRVASGPNSVPGDSLPFVAHPAGATTASDSSRLTPPQQGCLSWCSLERR